VWLNINDSTWLARRIAWARVRDARRKRVGELSCKSWRAAAAGDCKLSTAMKLRNAIQWSGVALANRSLLNPALHELVVRRLRVKEDFKTPAPRSPAA